MYWAIRQLEGDFVIEVDDKVLWSQWKGALVSVERCFGLSGKVLWSQWTAW
jgi:hypothetical protein